MAQSRFVLKEWFFDRDQVISRMSRTTMITFRKIGGNVRLISRRSIRKRKAASKAGEPPSSHEGSLKERIYYVWDPETESVVIGPERFNHVFFDGDRRPIRGAVPGVLEEGGDITRLEVFKWGKWRRADNRSRRRNAGLPRRYRTITIEARPFMAPALEKSKGRYADLWADTWSSGRVTTEG